MNEHSPMRKTPAGIIVRNSVLALGLVLVLAPLPGCAGFRGLALLFGEEETKTVKAEYAYLADQKVAIVVRADMETLFEYPQVRLELTDHVRVALETNLKGISIVEARKVIDLQNRNADWARRDPALLGKDLGADKLLEIDLTQYTTREPDSPHLYRAHIAAMVHVYNTAYPNSEPAYKTEVKVVYPERTYADSNTGERAVRKGALELFAQDLAGKFYERKVKAKD